MKPRLRGNIIKRLPSIGTYHNRWNPADTCDGLAGEKSKTWEQDRQRDEEMMDEIEGNLTPLMQVYQLSRRQTSGLGNGCS